MNNLIQLTKAEVARISLALHTGYGLDSRLRGGDGKTKFDEKRSSK
ncbi:hypothetical protein [Coxiella burnetii]|nr:hypothetical protein [Coxiella burnetii]